MQQLGFQVKLGRHALKKGKLGAGTPQERADDINNMFADPDVHAIISTHGGIFANSCLPYLDYRLLKANPKILMGFSDISTLHLGIYARTGLVTFHGNMVMFYFGMNPQEYDHRKFLGRLVHGDIGPVRQKQRMAHRARPGRGQGTAAWGKRLGDAVAAWNPLLAGFF